MAKNYLSKSVPSIVICAGMLFYHITGLSGIDARDGISTLEYSIFILIHFYYKIQKT